MCILIIEMCILIKNSVFSNMLVHKENIREQIFSKYFEKQLKIFKVTSLIKYNIYDFEIYEKINTIIFIAPLLGKIKI